MSDRLEVHFLIGKPLRIEIKFPGKDDAMKYHSTRASSERQQYNLSALPTSEDPYVSFDLPDSLSWLTWSDPDQQFIMRFDQSDDAKNWADGTICVRIRNYSHRVAVKQYLPEQESKNGKEKAPVGREDGKREKRHGPDREARHAEGNAGPPTPPPAPELENGRPLIGPSRRFKVENVAVSSDQRRVPNNREGGNLKGNARSSKSKPRFRRPPSKPNEHHGRTVSPPQGFAVRSERDRRHAGI